MNAVGGPPTIAESPLFAAAIELSHTVSKKRDLATSRDHSGGANGVVHYQEHQLVNRDGSMMGIAWSI